MFNWFSKVKVYETANLDRKCKVEELLRENNIEFTIEVEDLHTRNSFDALAVSQIKVKPKDVYSFYVDRKLKSEVLSLIKKIS